MKTAGEHLQDTMVSGLPVYSLDPFEQFENMKLVAIEAIKSAQIEAIKECVLEIRFEDCFLAMKINKLIDQVK